MKGIEFGNISTNITHTGKIILWAGGNSNHDRDGKCCPDFSCCGGKLAPIEMRARYLKAHGENDFWVIVALISFFITANELPLISKFKIDHLTLQ